MMDISTVAKRVLSHVSDVLSGYEGDPVRTKQPNSLWFDCCSR